MHLRKFTAAILLGTLAVTVRARPQSSGSGGCGVNRDGVSRQVGDSWSQDGCNNCRCLPSGVPGCTRRICSDREFWEEGRTCSEGKTWEEKTGEDLKVCTCTKGSPSCTDKVVKVASTSTAQCGEDSEGNPRLVGDSWKEECNNCRCTSTGVPVCTLRFCVNREEHECVDERGNRREHLEMWEEWEEAWEEEERSSGVEVNGNHKDCSCDNGEVICQVRQIAEEETGAFVASSPGRLGENAVACVDNNGAAREVGDTWMDECNNCMCTESGNSCTKMLCNFALPFEMSGLRTGADSQCLDGEGRSREIGENWVEDCNNCMCTKSGSSCTKKLCNFLGHNLNPGLQCTDEQNLTREHMESWEQVPSPPEVVKEVADVQLVWLTDLSMEIQLEDNKTDVIFLAPTSNIPGEETPCLFSGIVGKDQDSLVTVSGCQDDEEVTVSIASKRVPGGFVDLTISEGTTYSVQVIGSFGFGFESSTCTCTDGEISCVVQVPRPDNPFAPPEVPTAPLMASAPQLPSSPQSLLGSAPQLPSSAPQLPSVPKVHFPSDDSQDSKVGGLKTAPRTTLLLVVEEASDASQCQQAGVTRCRGVIISDVVKTLKAGAKLDLLQAGDVHMTLRRDPEVTTSGGVSLALALTDGGEGNIVVGTSGSMYGAVKPLEGPVHYTLESCGQGCSVLIERASDWFNQFED